VQVFAAHPVLPGDTNADGTVNFTDLLTLAQHYGAGGADWQQGDFDASGTVDFSDLLTLAQHYGQSDASGGASAAASAVPEPTGVVLLLGVFGMIRRRRSVQSEG
jgi:hypothetical protein